jgi:alpha-methylacyl-CoA racemase
MKDGRPGPLRGLRVVELAGIGPAPFAGMLLADMGADVLRVERPPGRDAGPIDRQVRDGVLHRGRATVCLDLKQPAAAAALQALLERADALIEGFRPGVMERLGLGPEVCLARNPRLVYGRITGWGQTGPLAPTAGHDINYIALSGALHAIGTAQAPCPPLNLVGDFGGGGMLVAFGVLCALLEARASGRGQVVDAAMTEGAALLMAMPYGFRGAGHWSDRRGANWLDGSAPFYGTYACADGRWIAVGPLEAQFHDVLLEGLGLPKEEFADRWDPRSWPALRARIAAAFAGRSRDAWCERFAGSDACVAPVLDLGEAPGHPHYQARGSFVTLDGVVQPAPAPRFSRTPAGEPKGQDAREVLAAWGVGVESMEVLLSSAA